MSTPSASYYDKGSEEAATETPLTVKRLEPRRKLTGNSKRLVIALVGLPARGKSFVSRKLANFITWTGMECKIFNVGKYRRVAAAQLAKHQQSEETQDSNKSERQAAGACDANFFDSKNAEAAKLRQFAAEAALRDMLKWLDEGDRRKDEFGRTHHLRHGSSTSSESPNGSDSHHELDRIAIFDATNSTNSRRQWILEECTSADMPTGVVFVESLCDDDELLEENFRYKVQNSPDFKGMGEDEAIADLQNRVRKYEEQYETITDDSQSYIKIYNLSTRLMVNHIYGRMAKIIVPALMAWNIGSRPVFLCRPGKTPHGIRTDGEDYVAKVDQEEPDMLDMSAQTRRRSVRGHSLGPAGVDFRTKLYEFIEKESTEFVKARPDKGATIGTGTSLSGLAKSIEESFHFPISVYTSTMPRAVQTVEWAVHAGRSEQLSNLNPLDKGDFNGMELEEIEEMDPAWYSRLERDPFYTRFPGGECYRDLINRLDTIIIDVEQQVVPVLIVSHVSILQLLIAYFRGYPVEKSTSIEVPIHTVLKYVPSRGGSWSESRHSLLPDRSSPTMATEKSDPELNTISPPWKSPDSPISPLPIWGDHMPPATRSVPPPPMIRKAAA